MAKARNLARNEECTVRIPGVCNWNPETSVLAHLRRGWNSGVGMKPDDQDGVIACSACHDVIDGRAPGPDKMTLDSYCLDALLRTRRVMEGKM